LSGVVLDGFCALGSVVPWPAQPAMAIAKTSDMILVVFMML
jgi:hypothetical protein